MPRTALIVATAACFLDTAGAFAPMPIAPATRSAAGMRPAMTLAPERVEKAVNLAKKNALQANREQWGINEPLVVSGSAAPATPAEAAPATKGVSKAKANALQANKEQWGIAAPLAAPASAPKAASAKAAPPSSPPSAPAFRKVSRDEVRALVRQLGAKGKQEAMPVLQACGYSGGLLENVWAEIEQARASASPASEYEKLFAEADGLVDKSTSTLMRADKLRADAKAAEAKIAKELEPKVRSLNDQVKAAEANVQQWGWFPLSTAQKELEVVLQQQENLKKEISSLKIAAAEGVAGSEALKAASKTELSEAMAKKAEAMRLRASTEGALKAAAQEKLEARLQQWEGMVAKGQGDQVKAALASPEVQEIFLALSLVPSAKYGASSLPGRVMTVIEIINASKSPAKRGGGGGAAAAAAASGDDADMTRRGVLGLIGAALLGGGGFFASQNPQVLKSLQSAPPPPSNIPPAPKAASKAPAPAAKPWEQ